MIHASIAKQYALSAQEIQRLEAIQLEIERKTRFGLMVSDTIHFCDTELSNKIDEASNRGDNSLTLYWGWDKWNEFEDVFKDLMEEKEKYANGDSSYKLQGEPIHVPTLCDYLVKNGYTVQRFEWSYMTYGCGSQTGVRIYIQWNP